MLPYLSPLRYPGGKGALAPYLGRLIAWQHRRPSIYVEPFAGGAGAALRLLFDEYVDRIVLNDVDSSLGAFWRAVTQESERFARRIETCMLDIGEWHRQREVWLKRPTDDFELGFATFYLNRTNRSGILSARPIGGLKQLGNWRLDVRFNREDLAARVRLIGRYRNRITVSQQDALTFLEDFGVDRTDCFYYLDPPYLSQGDLYLDNLSWRDHVSLAHLVSSEDAQSAAWLVTYDQDPRVAAELYPRMRIAEIRLAHTAANQHVGSEYAIFSPDLNVASLDGLGSGLATFINGPRNAAASTRPRPTAS